MMEVTRAGRVAVVRMAHGKANAMDLEMLRALRETLSSTLISEARAVVLTGTGTIFSAGVDLPRIAAGGRSYLEAFLPEMSACFLELFAFPKPVLAAINGHAIAGGCILACACDHRLMAKGTGTIGIPELKVGVPFPAAALEIVRHVLSPSVAYEAVYLGRTYRVDDALQRGFVDELVEPGALLDRTVAVAEELAGFPAATFARVKRDLKRLVIENWERLAPEHDRETLEAWASTEVQDSIRAYVARVLKR